MYQRSLVKFGEPFTQYSKENWKRFLDDCFIQWNKDINTLLDFQTLLNSINTNIQFTMEYNEEELPFLDILIKKTKDNKIETDIFYKATDAKQYLLFSSCHPRHTKINIPYNLARRICTIVSEKNTRDLRLLELKNTLLERHYPVQLINDGIKRAKSITTEELRKTKKSNKPTHITLPYVSTYNPRNIEAFNTIKQNLPILHKDPKLKRILHNVKIVRSHKQPKSLKKILTNARLHPTPNNAGVKKCNRPNCGTCPYILEGSTYHFKHGQLFTIKSELNCASKNLIYVIRCAGCQKEYIGSTGNSICQRCIVHRQQITHPQYRQIYLSTHIDTCAKSIHPQFSICPFYKCSERVPTQTRLNKELRFIQKYKPELNRIE